MQTNKDRLFKVLDGIAVDRPPCICPGGMMNMVIEDLINQKAMQFKDVHHDPQLMADIAESVVASECFENYGVPFCMTVEAEAFGAKVSFGSNCVEPHVTTYLNKSVTEWRDLPSVNHRNGRSAVVLDAIKLLKDKKSSVPIVGNITGPISTASSLMEPVNFYKELRKKNADAHAYMSKVTESLKAFMLLQIESGADLIAISDPSGTGEILGPKLFSEFMVPYINELIDCAKEHNIPTIVHICGQMKNVYKEVDCIKSNALSFDAMVNMKEARLNLPNRCIMGNLSTYALEFGTEEKIKTLTEQCLIQGVDILAPACGLGMRSPIKNIQTVLATVKEGNIDGHN